MYAGRVVEVGDVDHVFHVAAAPVHRRACSASLPRLDRRRRGPSCTAIVGQPADRCSTRRPGCPFHPRCPYACDRAPHRAAGAARTAAARPPGPPATTPRSSRRACPTSRWPMTVETASARHRHAPHQPRGDQPSCEVQQPRQALPDPGAACCRREVAAVHAGRRRHVSPSTGRDAQPGRRVRLRQVHHRAQADPAAAATPTSGTVMFDGGDDHRDPRARRDAAAAASDMQIVFQDPYASLHPRMAVQDIVAEPLRIHGSLRQAPAPTRVAELLDRGRARRPSTSTGTRTSSPAASASASASPARSRSNPKLLVLDEPVSALDVSIQARRASTCSSELQDELGLAYLFIAHDLSVVRHVSDRVARDVPRQDRRARRDAEDLVPEAPRTRTPRPCCRPCRCPTMGTHAASARIVLHGDLRARPTRRRAAASSALLAQGRPRGGRQATRRPASRSNRCSSSHDIGHLVACHFPVRGAALVHCPFGLGGLVGFPSQNGPRRSVAE